MQAASKPGVRLVEVRHVPGVVLWELVSLPLCGWGSLVLLSARARSDLGQIISTVHARSVGVSAAEAATLKKWVCPICSPEDEESRKRKSSEELALHEKVRKGECSPWPESAAGNKKRKGGRR